MKAVLTVLDKNEVSTRICLHNASKLPEMENYLTNEGLEFSSALMDDQTHSRINCSRSIDEVRRSTGYILAGTKVPEPKEFVWNKTSKRLLSMGIQFSRQ